MLDQKLPNDFGHHVSEISNHNEEVWVYFVPEFQYQQILSLFDSDFGALEQENWVISKKVVVFAFDKVFEYFLDFCLSLV